MVTCEGVPTTFTQANNPKGLTTGKMLAAVDMLPGDFTLQAGTPNGRELSVAEKVDIVIAKSGTGDHIAYLDVPNSRILSLTEATNSKALIEAEKVTMVESAIVLPVATLA
jgi:hypothetical protein